MVDALASAPVWLARVQHQPQQVLVGRSASPQEVVVRKDEVEIVHTEHIVRVVRKASFLAVAAMVLAAEVCIVDSGNGGPGSRSVSVGDWRDPL